MLQTSVRSVSLEETLSRIKKYAQIANITRIADLTGLDFYDIPVFASFRPLGKSLSTSQGKGFIKNAALCGAYMEAIEVYYAEEVKPQIFQTSYTELCKLGLTIDPELVNPFFYPQDHRYDWVAGKVLDFQSSSHSSIQPHQLVNPPTIYIPHPFICMDTTNPDIANFGIDTTGLASGNNLTEAILHGVLEIIERISDVTANIKVEMNIGDNSVFDNILTKADCHITLLPNKFEIPVFQCVIQNKNVLAHRGHFLGFGCHLDKHIALNRAITEAVQSSTTIIAGARDDIDKTMYLAQPNLNVKYDKTINFKDINSKDISDLKALTVTDSFNIIQKELEKHNEIIVYYPYLEEDIAVAKSFIINRDKLLNYPVNALGASAHE